MWSTDVLSKLHESGGELPDLLMEKYKYTQSPFLKEQLNKKKDSRVPERSIRMTSLYQVFLFLFLKLLGTKRLEPTCPENYKLLHSSDG